MRTTEVDRGGHSFEGLSISLWSSLFFHMTVLIDRVPLFFLYEILVFMYIFFYFIDSLLSSKNAPDNDV